MSKKLSDEAMTSRNPKDLWTGIIYIAVGLGRDHYRPRLWNGYSAQDGSGFLPRHSQHHSDRYRHYFPGPLVSQAGYPGRQVTLRGLLLVTGATLVFGLIVRGAGLVIAMPVLVMVSAYASGEPKWRTSIAMAIMLTVFCILIFLKGLEISVPILGSGSADD